MKKISLLAIATTLALGTVALAEPSGHGKKLERLDANKDGKVTLAEMKSEASARFKELDADKNGRVAPSELAAHREQMRAQWEQKRAEKRAARGEAEGERGEHGGKGHHFGKRMGGRFFEKLDANGDGAVDAQEFALGAEQRFTRMDENGDKVLAGAELEHRRGKHRCGHDKDTTPSTGAAGSPAAR